MTAYFEMHERETAKFHTLEVTAFDCQNAVVDTVEIEVSVGDINDHAPWFDPKSLLLTICPDTEVNSVVGQLQGPDKITFWYYFVVTK